MMANEQILRQAIEKAKKNGFKFEVIVPCYGLECFGRKINALMKVYHQIIFSHDFAKAFWKDGTQEYLKNPKDGTVFPGRTFTWEYHLQQMVLEEDPIKYLEQCLNLRTQQFSS